MSARQVPGPGNERSHSVTLTMDRIVRPNLASVLLEEVPAVVSVALLALAVVLRTEEDLTPAWEVELQEAGPQVVLVKSSCPTFVISPHSGSSLPTWQYDADNLCSCRSTLVGKT